MNSAHGVTLFCFALITASRAELWTKILSAAIPGLVATAYTVWKWWKDAKKK